MDDLETDVKIKKKFINKRKGAKIIKVSERDRERDIELKRERKIEKA